MNTKIKMRMLSILLCFVMLVGLMPITALAVEKNKISEFEATATLPDKLYVGMNLYDPNLLETISFNTTKGAPAKLDADSPWMYYNEEKGYYERIYNNDDARFVKAGVRYAYAAQLRIDGVDYETNTLAQHVDVKINGVLWNTSEDPYASSTVTYTWTQSPDFQVSGEPYRQKISRISATVNNYQNTYFYGDTIVLPSSYTVTVGIPAKFDDTTDVWQKKNGDTWEDCTENTFKGGTYRLKVKLVVDGEDNDTHYLNDGIWGAINGTTMSSRYWHSLDTPTHTANSSYVWMVFPEHVIEGPAGYTVAFDANGGTGNMASVNNVSGNYTLPPNGFTPPANKQFKCWSVNGNEKNPFESISVTADVTVKAVWKDIVTTSYTVSFDSNGGSGSMASVTNAPSLYTLPANSFTPPANKQFKCWAVGAQNAEYDPGDKITITADVTVKAVWKTITSSRQVISDVVATSSNLDTIPTLYGLLKIPTFTVTQGAPAYINATTSNLRWQKKVKGVWTNQDSGRFTPGEWRISSSLRIDGTNGYHYELGNPTTLTVNGQAWTVENNGKPSVHPSYSHANILSPVFTIVDDPNVQPPVPVKSVHMVLNGYTPDAAAASATVTTDANVTVEVLGFLEGIDSNGDGQPDTTQPVTGNFASGKLYAVVLKIKAKSGYDISGLTAQNVSLDRAIMDVSEENVIDDETFSGMYMLGDAMQYTVTFETNGGSAIQPVLVGGGGVAKEPAAPTKAYFAFAGWYSDSGLTQAFDFNTPITGDITLYAKWTPSPVNGMFLMTIDFNGGTSTMPTVGEVPANSGIYLNDNLGNFVTPPSGKVLAGYEIDGVPYAAGGDYLVTQNFTLKFLWKDAPVNTYTVSFNANGGSGTMADVTGISGEYTLPANGFTAPAGKQFKAWSVDGNEKAVGDKITVTADTTVKAVWETIPAAPADYDILDGANSSWTKNSDESLSIRGSGEFSKFVGVKVDGILVDAKNYTVKEGSTIVTLKADYLNTFSAGSHTLEIVWTDGSASTTFTVKADSPQTGDNSMMGLWIALLFVSGFGVVTTTVYTKKRKSVK